MSPVCGIFYRYQLQTKNEDVNITTKLAFICNSSYDPLQSLHCRERMGSLHDLVLPTLSEPWLLCVSGAGGDRKQGDYSAKATQCLSKAFSITNKQGPTQHRHMAHPVAFGYSSYSTALAEHAVHCPRRCLAFGRAGTCFFCYVCSIK